MFDGSSAVDIELNVDIEGVVFVDLMYISALGHGCYITIIVRFSNNLLKDKKTFKIY